MLKISVKRGLGDRRRFEFAQPQIVIGQLPGCDIQLSGSDVSPAHAVIEYHAGGYILLDTSSSGTILNERDAASVALRVGDEVAIGQYLLTVEEVGELDSSQLNLQKRWEQPFSQAMTHDDVEMVLRTKPFSDLDPTKFPKSRRLRHILLNDCRIRTFEEGDIIVREGDYGTSAFFILSGQARYFMDALPSEVLGRKEIRKRSALNILFGRGQKTVSSSDLLTRGPSSSPGSSSRVYIEDLSIMLETYRSTVLEVGDVFGEISALGRTPRPATIIAEGGEEVKLLEMRWQGVRDLRRYSEKIKRYIDELYRERSLKVQLRELPLFSELADEEVEQVSKEAIFESYGSFDWYSSYCTMVQLGETDRTKLEPVIVSAGDYVDGLILVRSGFVRVCEKGGGSGDLTLTYLGRGAYYGLEELQAGFLGKGQVNYRYTLRAVGYADILIIPKALIRKLVLSRPTVSKHIEAATIVVPEDTALTEFLADNRLHNGTSMMAIDLNSCIRCDDCVKACASAHDGTPRFIRHGLQFKNWLVTNACMHCLDPVCMIGCPTGAIHRVPESGEVVINASTCIGCSVCADSCPYNNIQMISVKDAAGAPVRRENSREPALLASKCDLCVEYKTGPACVRACPTKALKRIDASNFEAVPEKMKD